MADGQVPGDDAMKVDEEAQVPPTAEAPAAEEAPTAEEAPAEEEPAAEVGDEPAAEEPAAEEPAAEEPAAEAFLVEAPVAEAPAEAKEQEEDAPEDGRPRLSVATAFSSDASTPNAAILYGGRVLMALGDGGFQHLLVGARANVGLKVGRHFFEAVAVDVAGRAPGASSRGEAEAPKRVVRLGFAATAAGLLLPDAGRRGGGSVHFDADGAFSDGRSRRKVCKPINPDQVVAVLLNLDAQSPSKNTVSLFVDGVRASEPQPLPEALQGVPLFPVVCYRGATVRVNFGPTPLRPLPFRCTMLQGAASDDCEVVSSVAAAADGRHEVLVPVALPGEGMRDWCEQFLAKNRHFTELSRRAVQSWASRSRGPPPPSSGGEDRESSSSGDDKLFQRLATSVAPMLPRAYVLGELAQNLKPEGRKALLKRFSPIDFRRTAVVLLGEPPAEHKAFVQAALLEEKRLRAEAGRKPIPASAKKMPRKTPLAKADEAMADEPTTKEGEEEAAECAEGEGGAEAAAEAPPVELTEEEKTWWHRKGPLELSQSELARSFASFAVPTEDEGFDSIRFEWLGADMAGDFLRDWVLQRKRTTRIEDIQPGKWFEGRLSDWKKTFQEWKKKQSEWKGVLDTLNGWKKEGKEGEEKKDDKPTEVDAEELDVFAVENVNDIGNGEPLFANFDLEDWALLSLRFELHLILHAFRRDADDADRPSFGDGHLAFYYPRYYKKAFNLKFYGMEDVKGLLEIVKDTLEIETVGDKLLKPLLDEGVALEQFMKLTENDRRDRQRRVDAGDETAALKFTPQAPVRDRAPPPRGGSDRRAPPPASGSRRDAGSRAPPSRSSAPVGSKRPSTPASSRDAPASKQARTSSRDAPLPRGYGYGRDSGGSSYDKGSSGGYDRGSSGYDRSSSGYDRGSGGYGSGYERGSDRGSGYDKSRGSGGSYDKGSSYRSR